MSVWQRISQACVILLMLIAAWVARTICVEGQVWDWIVVYWTILTFKNLCDSMATREK